MRAITFPTVKGTKVRRNAETGIEIHSTRDDLGRTEYTIYSPDRDGGLSYRGTEFSLAEARSLATERVEIRRLEIADAYAEALGEHTERSACTSSLISGGHAYEIDDPGTAEACGLPADHPIHRTAADDPYDEDESTASLAEGC